MADLDEMKLRDDRRGSFVDLMPRGRSVMIVGSHSREPVKMKRAMTTL